MVLTVSFVVSPESRALLPPSPAAITTGLIPASGYQDATTSPSALMRLVFAHHRVHRIPLPTFVTTAKRPSFRKRDARKSARDLPDVTSESACDTLARRANQLEADNAAVKGTIFLCPGRGAISAFTRVFDALWCRSAAPGPMQR
jgi:hypothetical protein